MKAREEYRQDLYELIASASNAQEVKWLLTDLCTKKEIDNIAQRLEAAKLLLNGYTYQEVTEESSISSATLSRVSRSLQEGKGYRHFLLSDEKNS